MKTTLELPDELMRRIKIRAVQQDRRIKDVVAELLVDGLGAEEDAPTVPAAARVRLPLVHCAHPASAGQELTPERVAELLQDEEADWAVGDDSAPV